MTMHPNSPIMVEFIGTPEAGKTELINRLSESLEKKCTVSIIRESAEIVPDIFPKGSLEAHFWMRLTTAKNIFEKQFSKNFDITLIDRGLIDTLFWNYYYSSIALFSSEYREHFDTFFQNIGLKVPELVVFLHCSPEESIRRRGGEGRIVKLDFLKRYNELILSFIKAVQVPIFELDTTSLSKEDVFMKVSNVVNTLF